MRVHSRGPPQSREGLRRGIRKLDRSGGTPGGARCLVTRRVPADGSERVDCHRRRNVADLSSRCLARATGMGGRVVPAQHPQRPQGVPPAWSALLHRGDTTGLATSAGRLRPGDAPALYRRRPRGSRRHPDRRVRAPVDTRSGNPRPCQTRDVAPLPDSPDPLRPDDLSRRSIAILGTTRLTGGSTVLTKCPSSVFSALSHLRTAPKPPRRSALHCYLGTSRSDLGRHDVSPGLGGRRKLTGGHGLAGTPGES